jgi:hypothetical protein
MESSRALSSIERERTINSLLSYLILNFTIIVKNYATILEIVSSSQLMCRSRYSPRQAAAALDGDPLLLSGL